MYFDSHTHIHFHAFENDYREAVARAIAAGVGLMTSGTQRDTSAKAVEVAHEFEHDAVYASVGLHPVHTDKSFHDIEELGGGEAATAFTSRGEVFEYAYYKELARDPKVLAVGECGLDYYRLEGNVEEKKMKQKEVFEEHIQLAHEVKKPLIIHCRKAAEDVIDILRASRARLNNVPGVMHFFTDGFGPSAPLGTSKLTTGGLEYAKELVELGFAFSIGGVITFPPKRGNSAGDYDEMVRFLPPDRILTETDAPYVAPVPHRGKRNEPMYISEIIKKIAEIRGATEEEMKQQVWENTKRIFGVAS